MQAIYLNIVLTLIVGLVIGSKVSSLKLVFLKGFSLFNLLPLMPKNKEVLQTAPVKIKVGNRYFDELEIRLLQAIIQEEKDGLGIAHLNKLMNLTKLSEENQRQRRHLFLKELNLKLFLIFGVREGITRIESQTDKRIKMYVLNEKIDTTAVEEAIKA
jgi:hypothetical protein